MIRRTRSLFWIVVAIGTLCIWMGPSYSEYYRAGDGSSAWLFGVPIAAILAALPYTGVGYRSRALAGFIQALLFLPLPNYLVDVYDSNEWVTAVWTTWIVGYSGLFVLVTQGGCVLLRWLDSLAGRSVGGGQCPACWFDIRLLPSNRCTECGNRYDVCETEKPKPGAPMPFRKGRGVERTSMAENCSLGEDL